MADKVALGGLLISDLVFGTELAGTALGYLGLGATATYFGYEMTRERNDLTGIQGRPIISSQQQIFQQPAIPTDSVLRVREEITELSHIEATFSEPIQEMQQQSTRSLQQEIGRRPLDFVDRLNGIFPSRAQRQEEQKQELLQNAPSSQETPNQIRYRVTQVINPFQLSRNNQDFDYTRFDTYPAQLGVLMYQIIDFLGEVSEFSNLDLLTTLLSYNIASNRNFLQLRRTDMIQELSNTIHLLISRDIHIWNQAQLRAVQADLIQLQDEIGAINIFEAPDQRFIENPAITSSSIVRSYTFQFMLQTIPHWTIDNVQNMITDMLAQRTANGFDVAYIAPQAYGLLFQLFSLYTVAVILNRDAQPTSQERRHLTSFISAVNDIIMQLETVQEPEISDVDIRNALIILDIDNESMINPAEEIQQIEEEEKASEQQPEESSFQGLFGLANDQQEMDMEALNRQVSQQQTADIFRDYSLALDDAYQEEVQKISEDSSLSAKQKLARSIASRNAYQSEKLGTARETFLEEIKEEESSGDDEMERQYIQNIQQRVSRKGVKDLAEIKKLQEQLEKFTKQLQSEVVNKIIIIRVQPRRQRQPAGSNQLEVQLRQAQQDMTLYENQFRAGVQALQQQLQNVPAFLQNMVPQNIRDLGALNVDDIIDQIRSGTNIIEDILTSVPDQYRGFIPKELVDVATQISGQTALIQSLSRQVQGVIPQGQPQINPQPIIPPRPQALPQQEEQRVQEMLRRVMQQEQDRLRPRFGIGNIGLVNIPLFSLNFAGISMKIGRGNGKDGDAGDSIGKKKDPIIMPKPKVKTSINIILKQIMPLRKRKIVEAQKEEIVVKDLPIPKKRYTRRKKPET